MSRSVAHASSRNWARQTHLPRWHAPFPLHAALPFASPSAGASRHVPSSRSGIAAVALLNLMYRAAALFAWSRAVSRGKPVARPRNRVQKWYGGCRGSQRLSSLCRRMAASSSSTFRASTSASTSSIVLNDATSSPSSSPSPPFACGAAPGSPALPRPPPPPSRNPFFRSAFHASPRRPTCPIRASRDVTNMYPQMASASSTSAARDRRSRSPLKLPPRPGFRSPPPPSIGWPSLSRAWLPRLGSIASARAAAAAASEVASTARR